MTSEQQPAEDPTARGIAGTTDDGRVYVVTPTSMAVEGPPTADVQDAADETTSVTDMVEQPAKVMRIGTMIRQLLEEVKSAPLDDASRQRLGDPRGLDRGAEGGPRPGAGRRAGTDHAALQ